MATDRQQIQKLVLQHLATNGAETRLARGGGGFLEAVRKHFPNAHDRDVQEVLWSLIAQGLAYLDTRQPAASNWRVLISNAGLAALADRSVNPDDPAGYLLRLEQDVPDITDLVMRYVSEAVRSFNGQLYLASTVMLGVASEAAFLELADAFAATLVGNERRNFEDVLANRNLVTKFKEFRKRLEPLKGSLPESDSLALMLDSVLDLLRINRNEAGHPTGRQFDRDECFISLQMAARYMKKMYALKAHFEQAASGTP